MSYSRLTLAFALLGCSTSVTTEGDGVDTAGGAQGIAGGSALDVAAAGAGGNQASSAAVLRNATAPLPGIAGTPQTAQGGALSSGGSVATSAVEEPIPPTKLVLVYDTSGSMGDDTSTNRMNAASRWIPLTSAVVAMLRSTRMSHVDVALIFFPQGGTKEEICGYDYGTPVVPMSASSKSEIIQAITERETKGGTPTLPALWWAYDYARRVAFGDTTSRVRVLLLTDGEPAIYNAATKQTEIDCAPVGCSLTNTIADIATLAASNAASELPIITHVAGLGEAQSSMKHIATSGGGEFAQIDAMNDSSKTVEKLLALIAR